VDRLEDIRDRVVQALAPLAAERVALARAEGRFLAEPVMARMAAPPADCSAMDGYALRSADGGGPGSLSVVETVFAGELPARPLGPGEAARIFTGAPLPAGADAVVREESVSLENGRVRLRAEVRRGENVRRAGEDVAKGGLALPAGVRLGPRQVSLCAAVGVEEVAVHRRPRVTVISTGDELVRGRTPDSNGPAVAGLARAAGAEVATRLVGDDLSAVTEALAESLGQGDAVVTIGGVSVGKRDHVPVALERLGAELLVHGVPMKPGKPFLFARCGGKAVLGLPGSPSACLVAFEVFARPALLRLAGAAELLRRTLRLPLAEPVEGRPGRARFLWARLDPGGRARPLGRDAAQVRGPALADLLLCLPAGRGDLGEGEAVEAWLLEGDGA
jgi:molybdopterin molybdotransferase